ncbi:MAG: small acid-soluble spore protein SspI [Bacilli bacterium]
MNLDIRKYIINNFKESNLNDIEESINESIKNEEEVTLPGLGALMEILWKESNKSEKNKILQNIKKGLST